MIHLHYYICNVHKQKKQRDPLKPLTITINLAKIICTPTPERTQGGYRDEITHWPGYPRHCAYHHRGNIAPGAI